MTASPLQEEEVVPRSYTGSGGIAPIPRNNLFPATASDLINDGRHTSSSDIEDRQFVMPDRLEVFHEDARIKRIGIDLRDPVQRARQVPLPGYSRNFSRCAAMPKIVPCDQRNRA